MSNLINKRIKTLKNKMEIYKNRNIIDEALIEEEYKSIEMIKSNCDIVKINTNISKMDLPDKYKDILGETSKNNENKNENKKKNKNIFDLSEAERIKYLEYRKKVSDESYFENIRSILEEIPDSNGSRYYNKIKVNIGIIADEFLMNSYDGVANFIYITPDNYKDYIGKLDLFLVVTAWKGLNMEWKSLGNPNIRKKRNELFNIIETYKKQGTKIAFYSKEDPVNFDIFKEIATKCEYIFTTCEEIVDEYKKYCKNDNVHVLKFGVNPTYHNPIGFKNVKKEKKVIFSGSWYKKYPHRINDMKMLFDGVIDSNLGLKIIDRNYDLKLQQYFFPEKYLKYVSPAIEHEYLQKTHKLFDWAINFNSVKNSNTMFANRIYELQALGNILISNYSVGVNNLFPNVFIANEKEEVKNIINSFSEEDVYKHQILGIRTVMSNETSYDRIHELLNTVGINHDFAKRKVLVVANKINSKVEEMFKRQSYSEKELILEENLSEDIKNKYDIVAFFDCNKEYERYYLEDMVNAFKYTNSRYITRDSYYDGNKLIKGVEHNYINCIKDKYRTVFWANEFKVNELHNISGEVIGGYSVDHFEFNNSTIVKEKNKNEYKLSVIIPTYNNGKHLMNKCFNSLRRSSIFENMEIIIVDDGSTDGETQEIVKYINRNYNNVKVFLFDDSGSGSASRPRNKGVEIATTEYITFLDPDNEAINDGYKVLYDELIKNNMDMVVGNMLKLEKDKVLNFNYYKTAIAYNKSDIITENKEEYLVKSMFKGMSIQALVVKKYVIEKNKLKQIVGAVGQDTLFFYELLMKSKSIKVIDLPIHIYYAAVEGSTVNNISCRYFRRAFKIEEAKYKFYKENNLLKSYIETRFEYYMKNWYLPKLKKVENEDFEECVDIFINMLKIYEKDFVITDPKINEIIENYNNKNLEFVRNTVNNIDF